MPLTHRGLIKYISQWAEQALGNVHQDIEFSHNEMLLDTPSANIRHFIVALVF